MQFSTAALLAFAASVVAQNPLFNPITRPEEKEKVAEGSTFKIQWTAPAEFADVTVSISLIGGPEQGKQTHLVDIAAAVPNSAESYEWKVPGDLAGFPWYGIKIVSDANEEDYQYSNPFLVVADPNGSPSSSDAASTTTITTGYGTATVTLSAASTSSAEVSSSSTVEESSSAAESSSVEEPSTSAPVTTLTTATTATPTASSTESESSGPAESGPAEVDPDSAATQAKAGIFALVGGLAVALML